MLITVRDYIEIYKKMHPNDPKQVLEKIEASIMFLVQSWDRINEWYLDIFHNTDGIRDGKITPPPAVPTEAAKT